MAVVGTILLLGFGLDAAGRLAPAVEECTRLGERRGLARVIDALVVTKDVRGVLHYECDGSTLGHSTDPSRSPVWRMLAGNGSPITATEPLDLHSSHVLGVDLDVAESLAHEMDPGSSALFVLVDLPWALELFDAVLGAGGVPIVYGCLQPETMLILGPDVAEAVKERDTRDAIASAAGSSMLDALAAGDEASARTSGVIRTLIGAGFMDAADVAEAVGALAEAGFVAPIRRSEELW